MKLFIDEIVFKIYPWCSVSDNCTDTGSVTAGMWVGGISMLNDSFVLDVVQNRYRVATEEQFFQMSLIEGWKK